MGKNTTTLELTLEDGQVVGATTRVNAALKSIEDNSKHLGENTGFDKFAEGVKSLIEDPLGSAGNMAEKFVSSMGPVGVSLAAGVGAFAAFGMAAFEVTEKLGALALQYQNLSTRTGISTADVGGFAFAAKMTGNDVSIFETIMRRLSQGMDENSEKGKACREELARMGITVRDIHGVLMPTADIFNQISVALNKMGSAAEQDAAMMNIAGRAGVEALPTMLELAKNLQMARDLGLSPTKAEIEEWKGYHEQLTIAAAQWDAIWRKIEGATAATFMFWFAYSTGSGGPTGKKPVAPTPIPGMQYAGLLEMQPTISLADQYRIQANDRAVAALKIGSPEQQLSEAKKNLTELQGSLKTGVLPEVNTKTEADITTAKADVARLQAQVDSLKKGEADAKSRAAQLAKDQATTMAIIDHRGIMAGLALSGQRVDEIVPYDKEGTAASQHGMTENVAVFRKALEQKDKQLEAEIAELKKAISEGDIASRGEIEKQASGIETGAGQQVQLAGARHQLAGVGKQDDGEVALAQQELAIRMKALDNELAIKAARADLFDMVKEQDDYENRAQAAQFDLQLKILDLKKQVLEQDQKDADTFGKLVAEFSNAAQTGGHRGISQFFRGQAHGLEDTMIGNVASTAFKNFGSNIVPHMPEGPLGDLFKGTPFSPKSSDSKMLQDATLENTLATRDNSAAIRAMAMSRSGGGGAFVPGGGGGLDLTSGAWGSVGSVPGSGSGADMGDPFNITGGVGAGMPGIGDAGGGTAVFSPAALVKLGASPTVAAQLSGMMALSAKLKSVSSSMGGFMTGVGQGMSDPVGMLFGSTGPDGGYEGSLTTAQGVGAGVGIAGAGMGTYMGISQMAKGGAHNITAGIGTTLMSVAPLTGPAAPFVEAAGMVASVVSMILGDPRAQRGTQITNWTAQNAYTGPDPVSYARNMSGETVGSDMFGNSRQVGNQTTVTINAMDSESFGTYLQNRPTQLDNGLYNLIQNGSKSVPALRQQLLGG